MTTTFHSTRSTTDSLTAKQAIRKGIADDGGLFVSDALGKTKVDVASLPGKSYQQIAAEVLGALLPDFTAEELGQCIADAYGEQWSDERITPLKPLGDDYVLELFNGPTSAFKDVALQILPRFMAHTTPADGDADEKIMILTATSGDTGKAALAGFADAPGTAITVFYPEGKVSQVQELQMTTQAGSNVQVAAVEVRGQAHLRRPRPGRASRRQFARGAFLRQLHQRGPSGAAGRLLLLRLRPTARRPGDQRRR